jgi:hypothetical protein
MKDNHSSASIVSVSRLPDIHLLKTVNRPMSKPLSMAEVSLTMDIQLLTDLRKRMKSNTEGNRS